MKTQERFRSLDGLRGLAALVVVIYHVALLDRVVADKSLDPGGQAMSTLERIAHYSPAHIIWAGNEAVIVFFVLSGFVLALRPASGGGEPWRNYYPQRMVRLYVPAVCALFLAWVTTLVVTRDEISGGSDWLNEHARDSHGFKEVVLGSTLMGGSGGLNMPLWSLRWEVVFSLLLPIYLYVGYKLRSHVIAATVICAAVVLVSSRVSLGDGALIYLPVFGIGVAMAYSLPVLRGWAERINSPGWFVVTVISGALLMAHWNIGGFVDDPTDIHKYTRPIVAMGAAGIVFVSAWCPLAVGILTARPVQWLGTISFSLYLIHEPIVVGFAFATGGDTNLAVTYLACVPLALGFGWMFFRAVERPSHRLARRAGGIWPNTAPPKPDEIGARAG